MYHCREIEICYFREIAILQFSGDWTMSSSGYWKMSFSGDWNISFSGNCNTSIFGRLKCVIFERLQCTIFGRWKCAFFGGLKCIIFWRLNFILKTILKAILKTVLLLLFFYYYSINPIPYGERSSLDLFFLKKIFLCFETFLSQFSGLYSVFRSKGFPNCMKKVPKKAKKSQNLSKNESQKRAYQVANFFFFFAKVSFYLGLKAWKVSN